MTSCPTPQIATWLSKAAVLALATVGSLASAQAEETVRHSGRCQSLTILDRPSSSI